MPQNRLVHADGSASQKSTMAPLPVAKA